MNNDDINEANDPRNKLVKMADRSDLGWDTVAEYEADPIDSDSDDPYFPIPIQVTIPISLLSRKFI